MTKPKILFLCTGNSARSQMAEAFVRKYAGDRFEAYSAGLEPKGLNPLTVKVMNEIGVDVSEQKSKNINTYLGKIKFQYLVTVCDDADKNCPTGIPGVDQRMHWSFEDPAALGGTEEEKLTKFREVRDRIEKKVKNWLAEQG
ncbi:MAG TPA: arsenate reductase ArsC [Anaerolineales bacterium]|nr:arsenate reductase ArsC [Anaerolineales bacterium]